MTLRAVFLGLVGAAFVCAYTHFNDFVVRQTLFVGNHLPYSVYGGLIIFLAVINPLLRAAARRLALSGRELAVALALTLAGCVVPGSGLMTTFTTSLMMPHHLNRTETGWKEQGVVDLVPKKMLADISEDENTRLGGFVQGMSVGGQRFSMSDVPWGAWTRTLVFWLPMILTLWIGLIALAVVVHRQWSDHEQLPYPIAAFANSLLPAGGEPTGSVFRNRLFLIGAGAVLAIHLNNYACQWFPGLVRVPTVLKLGSLRTVFPSINSAGAWWFFWPRIYFTPIAFAYFLTTSVSFSLGIGPVLFAYITGVLAGYGVSVRGGGYFSPNYQRMLTAGAYIGLLMTTIYTGRHYYCNVMRRSLGLRSGEKVEPVAVWAARVFLVAMAVFAAQLIVVGLDWQIALFHALMTAGIFLVMSRIAAETGMFFIQPLWAPCVLLVGLFGPAAFGPRTMAIMFLVSTVLLIDPREALMPYVTNALKVLDLRRVRIGRPAVLSGVVLVVGLAVAIPLTLYFQYDRASHMTDRWASYYFPKAPFEEVVSAKTRLEAQGSLERSESVRGFARLAEADFDGSKVLSFAIGVALVAGCSVARWHIPRWPIHPILFLTWHPSAPNTMFFSLLAGCLIKFIVMKYGGERVYKAGKPLMFGLIAGDMLGGIIPSIIAFVYYTATGDLPKSFSVMPG